ncbi:MAG: NERD nuclease [Flavobacteriales bacterium]|nr:NERD nuclease [Flavobacteriales bacterium]|tara:strand:- start:79 stop:708 length:630 start_codon:yes stop_codon:yes gene_type:complete
MEFLFIIIILAIFLVVVFKKFGNTAAAKGRKAEARVSKIIQRSLKNERFGLFNDLLIEHDGDITQIDHVLICDRGIFVIETKNLKGWIFGGERSRNWTHVLYQSKHKFQNPLHQNYKHIKVLQAALELPRSKLISLVVFTNRAEFKTEVPANVIYIHKLRYTLFSWDQGLLKNHEIDEIYWKLDGIRMENNRKNRKLHRRHVKNIARNK